MFLRWWRYSGDASHKKGCHLYFAAQWGAFCCISRKRVVISVDQIHSRQEIRCCVLQLQWRYMFRRRCRVSEGEFHYLARHLFYAAQAGDLYDRSGRSVASPIGQHCRTGGRWRVSTGLRSRGCFPFCLA